MEGVDDETTYNQVATNIKHNIQHINDLLGNCEITTNIASDETKFHFEQILTIDPQKLINNKPQASYYDLDAIGKIFEMLEPRAGSDGKRKALKYRCDSVASLMSDASEHDQIEQDTESIQDILNCLKDIKANVERISNSSIQPPDIQQAQEEASNRNSALVDQASKLQKIAREIQNIANTDKLESSEPSIQLDDDLISNLQKLSQVSELQNQQSYRHLIINLL